MTSQTSMRSSIVGHTARNLDAQKVFLNTFKNVINSRVDISEDIQRFQKTLQYARSQVDYEIREFIYMLPSDMNLRIGKIKNYNNKILLSSSSFNIGTSLKLMINIQKRMNKMSDLSLEPGIKSKKEDKQDIKIMRTKPDIKSKKEDKQDIKMTKAKSDMNEITNEEERQL